MYVCVCGVYVRGLYCTAYWSARPLRDDACRYWNDIDSQIEVPLEVLDDWMGEAAEIYAQNPWLNYPEVMHHVREMGFSHPLFDVIDERRLEVSEMLKFLQLIFGAPCRDLPDPRVDAAGFAAAIEEVLADVQPVLSIPEKVLQVLAKGQKVDCGRVQILCEPMAWINLAQLKKCYGNKSGACTVS
jgi:hypothetical protein